MRYGCAMPRIIASPDPASDAYARAEMGLLTALLDDRSASDDDAPWQVSMTPTVGMPSFLSNVDAAGAPPLPLSTRAGIANAAERVGAHTQAAAQSPRASSSRGYDATCRVVQHLVLQSTLYTSCAGMGATAAFGAMMLGALGSHQAQTRAEFFERNTAQATALGALGGALVVSAMMTGGGIARMGGARPLYYRLAPPSSHGDGAVIATLGAIHAGWLIALAAYLLVARVTPEVRFVY